MNDHIQKLLDQSRIQSHWSMDERRYLVDFVDQEKFADLIVKECIDYCGENLSKTVGGALKIHFGVEE